jgi:hypothetical protein
MVSDIEISRSAKRLIIQYGKDAFSRAEERAAAYKGIGDNSASDTWSRIAAAILELQEDAPPDEGPPS